MVIPNVSQQINETHNIGNQTNAQLATRITNSVLKPFAFKHSSMHADMFILHICSAYPPTHLSNA